MPHLFVDRPRQLDLIAAEPRLRADFAWETVNAAVYVAGGGLFVAGSFFFFPRRAEFQDTGCLLFFLGSMLYVAVTCYDLVEVCQRRRQARDNAARQLGEAIAAVAYLGSSILFAFGSVFFSSLLDWAPAGAWAFIVGCAGFALGAGINLLQIVRVRSAAMRQLEDLTAIAFLIGSVLFATASIPYLWDIEWPEAGEILYRYLAWLYLAASVLFVLGGVFNYWRAYLLNRQQPAVEEW
jgi:hypothetical protein